MSNGKIISNISLGFDGVSFSEFIAEHFLLPNHIKLTEKGNKNTPELSWNYNCINWHYFCELPFNYTNAIPLICLTPTKKLPFIEGNEDCVLHWPEY